MPGGVQVQVLFRAPGELGDLLDFVTGIDGG